MADLSQPKQEEDDTVQGTCNCGAIQISLPRTAFPSYCGLCHCKNCRASSGSLFSLNLPIPRKSLTFTTGQPKLYINTENGPGREMKRFFCGDCGSPIMSIGEENPEQTYLKGGLFVKTGVALPKAAVDVFWRGREGWEVSLTGECVE